MLKKIISWLFGSKKQEDEEYDWPGDFKRRYGIPPPFPTLFWQSKEEAMSKIPEEGDAYREENGGLMVYCNGRWLSLTTLPKAVSEDVKDDPYGSWDDPY